MDVGLRTTRSAKERRARNQENDTKIAIQARETIHGVTVHNGHRPSQVAFLHVLTTRCPHQAVRFVVSVAQGLKGPTVVNLP
jgi:hypothetical protein